MEVGRWVGDVGGGGRGGSSVAGADCISGGVGGEDDKVEEVC